MFREMLFEYQEMLRVEGVQIRFDSQVLGAGEVGHINVPRVHVKRYWQSENKIMKRKVLFGMHEMSSVPFRVIWDIK